MIAAGSGELRSISHTGLGSLGGTSSIALPFPLSTRVLVVSFLSESACEASRAKDVVALLRKGFSKAFFKFLTLT